MPKFKPECSHKRLVQYSTSPHSAKCRICGEILIEWLIARRFYDKPNKEELKIIEANKL